MKIVQAKLKSVSPYSQGKFYQVEPLQKESKADYEVRTWRERIHATEDGHVFIPPMAFKNCLSSVAKFLGQQIPGKGKATYTKHFVSGILVTDPLVLPIKKEDVVGVWRNVPSDGVRGGGKRVSKCFPEIPSWEGTITIYVLDETITLPVLKEHLIEAGKYIGIGVFRPQNNGFFGRFSVESVEEVN